MITDLSFFDAEREKMTTAESSMSDSVGVAPPGLLITSCDCV